MPEEVRLVPGASIGVITLHFNVPNHCIPLSEFTQTSESILEIINSFNREIFDNTIDFELVVLPPEPGTFKSRLGVIIVGAITTIWGVLETDIGKAFVKGLTHHEPAYHAEQLGIATRKALDGTDETAAPSESDKRAIISSVVSESTRSFLEKDHNALRASGISTTRFRDAYQARNNFYEACYENREIASIGFSDDDDFPIQRSEFPNFIVDLPPPDERQDPDNRWIVEIVSVQVTSPNWDRSDSQRRWKARLPGDKSITFTIDDDYFWILIDSRKIRTRVLDNLKIQLAYILDGARKKHARVLRVLDINGSKLAEPLSEAEITEILGRFTFPTLDNLDLFD